jgi:hypothetical protein
MNIDTETRPRHSWNQQDSIPLEITYKEGQGVGVLTLVGRLVLPSDFLVFCVVFDDLIDKGQVHIALNLSRLSELNATGVDRILYAARELQKAGGDLAIYGLETSLLDPRAEARLGTLRIFETEQEALDSFSSRDTVRHYDVLELVRAMKRDREH